MGERKTCSVEGCASGVMARMMCSKHYNRMRNKGSTGDQRKNAAGPCSMDGCDRPRAAFGRCDYHYRKEINPKPKIRREGRTCAHCGSEIAAEKNSRATFCSRDCKDKERVASGRAREDVRRYYFNKTYGLTLAEIDELLDQQGRRCAICRTDEWGGRHGGYVVDHCHKTGQVRGLLCSECNTGLGKLKDDPDLLRRAIEYLTP